MRLLPGAERVLADRVLPQPDQLCGPYAAGHALRALLAQPPSVTDLARAAGTAVWPDPDPAWRPAGAPLVADGWDRLPRAARPEDSGTDAAGLAAGVEATTGLAVVGVQGTPVLPLLAGLLDEALPVAVLANLLVTAPMEVGHFVVVLGVDGSRVLLADSYAELGEPGLPPGCRAVAAADLDGALTAPPGRGLLLVVPGERRGAVEAEVRRLGLRPGLWRT